MVAPSPDVLPAPSPYLKVRETGSQIGSRDDEVAAVDPRSQRGRIAAAVHGIDLANRKAIPAVVADDDDTVLMVAAFRAVADVTGIERRANDIVRRPDDEELHG